MALSPIPETSIYLMPEIEVTKRQPDGDWMYLCWIEGETEYQWGFSTDMAKWTAINQPAVRRLVAETYEWNESSDP